MNPFQVLGLALTGLLGLFSLARLLRSRARLADAAWLLLWLAAGAAIARPEITVVVARLLGISRGADLVFYLAILAMLVGFFVLSGRLRRLEADVTRLVRHLALRDPSPPGREGRGSGPPEPSQ